MLGRSLVTDGILRLGYSCSGIEFYFDGTLITAELEGEYICADCCGDMFIPILAIAEDGRIIRRIPIEAGRRVYELYRSEERRRVRIALMKLSDHAFNKLGIVSLNSDAPLSPVCDKRPLIEFVGDSITCGFGDEGRLGVDGFRTSQQNPYDAYAALCARKLDCRFSLVSHTGIGVYSSSVDENADEPNTDFCMPRVYEYSDLLINSDKWDFSDKPALIVVNLGTNDLTYTRDIPERLEKFERCYMDFIARIRELNPSAAIICALGAMGQELCPQVECAAAALGGENSGIYTLRFDVQSESDGIGAEKHPSLVTHAKMADKLCGFIRDKKLISDL